MQSEDSVEGKRKMCSGELSLSALTCCLVTGRDTAWELGETPLFKFSQIGKPKINFLAFSHCSSYSLSLLVFILLSLSAVVVSILAVFQSGSIILSLCTVTQ